ncbi:MAG: LamG domain-containing protein, partial [Acidimicrobiia bacterium]|nr:LamG domain-containing protein [Acidimicrobiia bacterium]
MGTWGRGERRLRGRVHVAGRVVTLTDPRGTLTAGVWHHAALTHDGTTMRLYLDGAEVAAAPASGSLEVARGTPVVVGSEPTAAHGREPQWFFDGLIDDVRIHERALDAVQVAALAAPGSRFPELSPLRIGASTGSSSTASSPALAGRVRRLRVWDHRRSDDELRALRDRELAGDEPGIDVLLPIATGSGTVLQNLVADGAPGTVVPGDGRETAWHVVDRAVRLDGVDQFVALGEPLPSPTGTFELLARFDTGRDQILLDASDSDDLPWFVIDLEGGLLRFRLADDLAGPDIDMSASATGPAIWHHVVATWSFDDDARTATLQLYVDDLSPATVTVDDVDRRTDLRAPYVGMCRGEADRIDEYGAADGEVREIRVWSTVRDAASIDRFRRIALEGTEQGLVAHHRIDEGEGARLGDASEDQRDATLSTRLLPRPHWDRRPAKLLRFGPSYAVLPTNTTLGLAGADATIEAWVRLPDIAGDHPIVGTSGPAIVDSEETWSLRVADGVLHANVGATTLAAADLTLTAATWHHVAARHRAGELTLWLDGALSSQRLEGLEPLGGRRFHVGHRRTYAGEGVWSESSLGGFVDELRLWSVALADERLQVVRPVRTPSDAADLCAVWRFDDRADDLLLDRGPRHLHPTLVVDERAGRLGQVAAASPPIRLHPSVLTIDAYNDYLDLGTPHVQASDGWTLAFWFRLEHVDGTHVLCEQDGTVRASVQDACFQIDVPDGAWEEIFLVAPGTWTHVAVVHRDGELHIVRDGVEIGESYPVAFADAGGGALRFGAPLDLTDSTDIHLGGQLAEIELWTGSRTTDEISVSRHHPRTGREPGLAACWRLTDAAHDEGRSSTRDLRDTCELEPAAVVTGGLEDTRTKWRPDPPPIAGAVSSLVLDGRDDHIVLGPAEDLLAPAVAMGALCVEAWYRHPGQAVPGRSSVLGCTGADGTPWFGLVDGRAACAVGDQEVAADAVLTPGWHHLVWTHDATAGHTTIYVDGGSVIEASGEGSTLQPPAGATAHIGRCAALDAATGTTVDHFLDGALAEVAIWSTVPSEEQLRTVRAHRLAGNEDGLVAYWIFDDRHQVTIPSRRGGEGHRLVLTSNGSVEPPLWDSRDDHPVLVDHLARTALNFDGEAQYLGLDDFNRSPSSFTVEAWVNTTQSATETRPRQECPILWRGSEPDAGPETDFELRITSGGHLAFAYRPVGSDGLHHLQADDVIPMNTLAHVAVTASAEGVRLYIDGELSAELSSPTPRRYRRKILRVGQGDAGGWIERHRGLIQELRIWSEARPGADLAAHRFVPLVPAEHPALIGCWPLSVVDNGLAANAVRPDQPLLLGGAPGDRRPDVADLVRRPTPFLDPAERVLTTGGLVSSDLRPQLSIPPFDAGSRPDRRQRTIEVWFCCDRPNAAGRQIVYREGDDHRYLSITIENGHLTFAGANLPDEESGWRRTTIATDLVRPGQWHHAALLLDGRADVQDNGFAALIDGRLIDVAPASQVWGAMSPVVVGGLRFEPTAEASIVPAGGAAVERTGSWHATEAGSLHDRNKSKGQKSLRFPIEGVDGFCRVAIAHPADDPLAPRHASDVPIDIEYAGGTVTVLVDLRRGGGAVATDLGEFDGVTAVTVHNRDTDALVVVDAVEVAVLRYHNGAPPPDPGATDVSLLESEQLSGQIKEVRVWERARGLDEIRASRFDIETADAAERNDLLFRWRTADLPESVTAPLRIARADEPRGGVPPTIDLVGLATLTELAASTGEPVERLSALVAGLRHSGRGDDPTLFDQLFNPPGLADDQRWSYFPSRPRRWVVESIDDEHRAFRSRLMGALRVSWADLARMVAAVAGIADVAGVHTLDLDGRALTLLYRLRLLSTVTELPVADVLLLMRRLDTGANGEAREPAWVVAERLADLTLDDVVTLRERAAWHRDARIDVAEFEYLVHDVRDGRVAVPFEEGALVDGATHLVVQVA